MLSHYEEEPVGSSFVFGSHAGMAYKGSVTLPGPSWAFPTMAPDEQIITQLHARPAAGASKALGVLAAVSAGGLMALRMKQAPLLFLAGAAAMALLSRKRVIPTARPIELMPRREPEPVPQPVTVPPEVDAWLARQMEREQQTPVITLEVVEPMIANDAVSRPEIPITALEPSKPEVNDQAELPPQPMFYERTNWHGFLSETPPEVREGGLVEPFKAAHTPEPLLIDETVASPSMPVAPSSASWLLDIEPLPSLDDLAADASSPAGADSEARGVIMTVAPGMVLPFETPDRPPIPQPEAPAAFVPALFQGGALPDEITVAEVTAPPTDFVPELEELAGGGEVGADGPPAESVMAGLFMPASSPMEPPTLAVEALEVPVAFAGPGEATFDDPLAFLEENPSSLPGGLAPPPPLRPLAPVVEAEIVVRPRGLAVTKVQPKSAAEVSHEFTPSLPTDPMVTLEEPFEIKTPPASSSEVDRATIPVPELPPAPIVLPREQKARKTWRSWWRGD